MAEKTQQGSAHARRFWWTKVRPAWLKVQWPLVWTVALIALVLGLIGFRKYFAAVGEQRSFLDLVYNAVQLFVMESGNLAPPLNWQLEVARFLAPAVTIYTASKAFLALFRDQFVGLRLAFYRHHIVIAGLGKRGFLLTKNFRQAGQRVVVLEADASNPNIERCREEGAVVLIGNAATKAQLRKAGVPSASYLISVLADDGANAELAAQAREVTTNKRDSALTCLIHIVEPQLRTLLSGRELATNAGDSFRLEFFNIFQLGARALLQAHPPFTENEAGTSHLLVVGLGRMGQSLCAYAASEWFESNFRTRGKLAITVVDKEANEKVELLGFRHPQVKTIARITSHEMDVFSSNFQKADFLFDEQGNCDITRAYVCLDNDAASLYAGLSLLDMLQSHSVSVVVRMTHDAGLASLLRKTTPAAGRHANLHSFNLLNQTCNMALLPTGVIETLAREIHEAYTQHQLLRGEDASSNPALAPWDELPERLRESNRRQAEHISKKLEAIGCGICTVGRGGEDGVQFSADEIDQLAELEHERWLEERARAGWTFADGPKDLLRQTSPDLLPWRSLTDEVREIDRETARAIPDLLRRAGFQISRWKS